MPDNTAQRAAAIKGPGGAGRSRIFSRRRRRHRAFFHDKGIGPLCLAHEIGRAPERRGDGGAVPRENLPRHAHRVKQRFGDLAHEFMLRFVLEAGLAAVGGDDQKRDLEDIGQRCERIDGVAEAGVLHHHHRAAPADGGPGRGRQRVALVGGRHIMQAGVIDHIVYKRGQKRAGHAAVTAEAQSARRLDKFAGVDHGLLGLLCGYGRRPIW